MAALQHSTCRYHTTANGLRGLSDKNALRDGDPVRDRANKVRALFEERHGALATQVIADIRPHAPSDAITSAAALALQASSPSATGILLTPLPRMTR